LLKQVADHLSSHHSVSRDELGHFLTTELDRLEDYEIDLIFSPLFTPTLEDQASFSSLLDTTTLALEEWPALVRAIAQRPTRARLVTEDGQTHELQLREVTIERYVTRLNLDVTLPDPLARLLDNLPPAEDRALLKALARRAIWRIESRRDVLFRYLLAATSNHFYNRDDVIGLLRLMETYQPNDAADLIGRIPHWQEVIRKEITSAASPKPFFADRVQELHGGGRDQRQKNQPFIDTKQRELVLLERLQTVLGS
jgi:hypothetical protein